MGILFKIFFFLQVFTSTILYFSINPIYSVLLLILLFFESAIVLSLFTLEFLSLLFILIYVGAIAILFLFVIMLLQLKLNNLETLFFFPIMICLNFLIFFSLFGQYPLYLTNPLNYYNIVIMEIFNELFIFGQVLYNYLTLCFLLAGIILLLALLGSIIISFDFFNVKFNNLFKQESRSDTFITFFK